MASESKRKVHARMAATGETYLEAKAALEAGGSIQPGRHPTCSSPRHVPGELPRNLWMCHRCELSFCDTCSGGNDALNTCPDCGYDHRKLCDECWEQVHR